MIGTVLAVMLLMGAPQDATGSTASAPAQAPAATQRAIPPGQMDCVYSGRRNRTCTTSEGETLQCQKQRQLGSHFDTWVCLTYREGQTLQNDSQHSLDHQQHITTPDQG